MLYLIQRSKISLSLGKGDLKKCESAQNKILKLKALQDSLLLANGRINNELTVTRKILMSHRKPHNN